MAVVTKIGNLLNKYSEKPELVTYLESDNLAEDWKNFVKGELANSNERNNRNLGGHQPRSSVGDDDDADNHYEVNMEQIMKRFTNFNSMVSSSSSNQDDDEDDEDDKKEGVDEEDRFNRAGNEEAEEGKPEPLNYFDLQPKNEVEVKGEFHANHFWGSGLPIDSYNGQAIDDLLLEEGM
jgi:hypothetical protein